MMVVASIGFLMFAGGCVSSNDPFLALVRYQNPGRFRRPLLEEIVQQVRQARLKPGAEAEFRLDNLDDPKSLRPAKPDEMFVRGGGAGNIWASVSPDGHLSVVIETRDLGHAGEYGFAFSDVPMSATRSDDNWFTIDVPGRLHFVQPNMRIDNHWWQVVYNLD